MAATVRAALYLRVSTGRQADSDLSIPDQRRQAKAYCASRGWEIVSSDPLLKERVTELKSVRDQARADAERAEGALDRAGPRSPQALKTFASQARRRMRTESGGYRRDHLRALAQRIEVDAKEVRIMGRKPCCFARSSLRQTQKRRVLACPVQYRSGAPDTIRTCDLCLRRATLYPAELRVQQPSI